MAIKFTLLRNRRFLGLLLLVGFILFVITECAASVEKKHHAIANGKKSANKHRSHEPGKPINKPSGIVSREYYEDYEDYYSDEYYYDESYEDLKGNVKKSHRSNRGHLNSTQIPK